mmetsp:Transcript_7643/g.12906  ORF Transcript_7643/g.12906 Transcript_7643/m.12906 type:complete len:243 (+) Transcript_7643:48-776(+)
MEDSVVVSISQDVLPYAIPEIHVTRIRVANLCCTGEERIIRASLDNLSGVHHIAVNIVGRYVVVKHCPVTVPSERLVEILNEKYLGASVHEVGGVEDESDEEGLASYIWRMLHFIVVCTLMITGLVLQCFHHEIASIWMYITSTIIGIGPLLYSAGIALFMRGQLDIHVLMVIAILGAMGTLNFFDASLVTSLFMGAELVEDVVMARLRKAVQLSSAGTIPTHAYLVDGSKVPLHDITLGMV